MIKVMNLVDVKKASFDGATVAVTALEKFFEDHPPLSLIRNPTGFFSGGQIRDFLGGLEDPGEREVVGELPIQLHPFLFALSEATKLIAAAQRWDMLCSLCQLADFVHNTIAQGVTVAGVAFDGSFHERLEGFKGCSETEFSHRIARATATVSNLQGVFDYIVKAMFGGTEDFLVCRGGAVIKVDTPKARRINLAELLGAIGQSQQVQAGEGEGDPPTS